MGGIELVYVVKERGCKIAWRMLSGETAIPNHEQVPQINTRIYITFTVQQISRLPHLIGFQSWADLDAYSHVV